MDGNQPPAAPGAPADGGTGGPAPTGTTPTQNPPAPANGPGAPPPAPAKKTDLATLPEDVRDYIESLRTENATHRTGKKAAEDKAAQHGNQLAAVLKALGKNADGTDAPPDPAALAAQIEDATAAAWTRSVENVILRAQTALGIDGDRLLDSRAFIDSLDEFVDDDPNTGDFKAKLTVHVKAYIGKHPQFKATPAGPARSGGDLSGGPGGNTNERPVSLREAYARRNRG